ncbi:MAG: type II toxin-antitoxin system HicB family antitoxin [Ignavibacteria bacterium]|nr:type II toxin-antitoxin system HicB family antitoxin [Ignavibacteria bacterium]MBL7992117.1 type II toxin-antitoxin system HicB family antitoxin [Candidatus Kapabacteria bacterium]
MQTYVVIIEHYDLPRNGRRLYGAFVPDVPGCTATGYSVEQVLERIRQALATVLEALQMAGREIPSAHSLEEHKEQSKCSDTSLLGANSIVAMIDVQVAYRSIARAA